MDDQNTTAGADIANDQNVVAPQEMPSNPLAGHVVRRDYTRPNIPGANISAPIGEPVFTPAPVQPAVNGQGPAQPGQPAPAVNPLPLQDQKEEADNLVDVVMDGYKELHKFGNKLVKFPVKKYTKAVREGIIDGELVVPIDQEGTPVEVTLNQYVGALASETEDVISVDPEFEEKVRPLLKREFMKSGAGMSDSNMLIYHFGKDIFIKGAIIYQVREQNNDMLAQLVEMTEQYRAAAGGNGWAPPAEQHYHPQQQAAPAQPATPAQPVRPAAASGTDYLADAEQQVKQTPPQPVTTAPAQPVRQVTPAQPLPQGPAFDANVDEDLLAKSSGMGGSNSLAMPEYGDKETLKRLEQLSQATPPQRQNRKSKAVKKAVNNGQNAKVIALPKDKNKNPKKP